VCGWEVKLCDTLVTDGPYLSTLKIRSLHTKHYLNSAVYLLLLYILTYEIIRHYIIIVTQFQTSCIIFKHVNSEYVNTVLSNLNCCFQSNQEHKMSTRRFLDIQQRKNKIDKEIIQGTATTNRPSNTAIYQLCNVSFYITCYSGGHGQNWRVKHFL